jgi:hypothetical protein
VKLDIYFEYGKKKVFACSTDWPGWSRSSRDEESALKALLDYAPRYARAVEKGGVEFQAPVDITGFEIIERLEGGAATDFGAPEVIPDDDSIPLDEAGFRRYVDILHGCHLTFQAAREAARGKELRLGPRGGGRDLDGVTSHVIDAHMIYLRRINQRAQLASGTDLNAALEHIDAFTLEALNTAFRAGLPESGPRGGKIWPIRYFIRRSAWHLLDHAWELEDRIV